MAFERNINLLTLDVCMQGRALLENFGGAARAERIGCVSATTPVARAVMGVWYPKIFKVAQNTDELLSHIIGG